MGEKIQNSYSEAFQTTYVYILPLRRCIITPHYLRVDYALWCPSKEYSMERVGGVIIFQWRNLTNTTSDKCSRLISTIISYDDNMCSWYVMKWPAIFVVFFPKTHYTSLMMRKQTIEEHSTKYLISTSQNCQGNQNQSKFEKLSQSRVSQWDMTTKCNEVSWMGPWNIKRTLGA